MTNPTAMNNSTPQVYFIGAGPGAADYSIYVKKVSAEDEPHTPCHSERSEESTANAPDGEFVARAPSESAA